MPNPELLSALRIETYAERRANLRKLATPALSRLTSVEIADAFIISEIIGTAANQVDPRPTVSGLRDALDEDTLIGLIEESISATDVLQAIIDPQTHGVESTGSKCGFSFGRPRNVRPLRRADLLSANPPITYTPTETKTMTNLPQSLQQRIDIHDACVAQGHDSEDVLDAMRSRSEIESHIDSLANMLSARDETPSTDVATLSDEVRDLVSEIVSELDGPATEKPSTSEPEPSTYALPSDANTQLIDLTLTQAGLPGIAKILGDLEDATAKAKAASLTTIPQVKEASTSVEIPSGMVTTRKAADVFGIKGVAAKSFAFDVPVWEWDAPHPHVPHVDHDYHFQGTVLLRVLYAILTNKRVYLHGHSGTGKTTHIEQVAARLQWPFMRVNFDSEITRMDLIGRDTLVQEGGVTVSKFVDGILPQMMAGPYIGCFDELDFVRPDVAYVMQRMFEGNGLMLTEDGGRIVKPHAMFRMFATGNTVGQGDEFGMYQGARPQSMAMLDRFTVWAHVEYLSEKERAKLIAKRVPSLNADLQANVNKYVTEHIEAFETSKVMQPITPRGYLDLASALAMFLQVFPAGKESKAVDQAVAMTVLDRASAQDRAVLKGIVNRVFA